MMPVSKKRWKIVGLIVLALLIIAFTVAASIFLGRFADLSHIDELERFKAWCDGIGILKYPVLLLLQMLQIIVALIPGGPVQILMGFVCGTVWGMILSLTGIVVATWLIILAERRYGKKLAELFVGAKSLEKLGFLRDPVKRDLILFLLFLIPGTPKDALTYFAPLTDLKTGKLITIVTVARIPSLFGSVYLGATLSKGDLKSSVLIFAVTAVVGITGILFYDRYTERKKEKKERSNENQ